MIENKIMKVKKREIGKVAFSYFTRNGINADIDTSIKGVMEKLGGVHVKNEMDNESETRSLIFYLPIIY